MSHRDRDDDPGRVPGVVLLYDSDAYEERPAPAGRPGPLGLMGRQVAGRAFLDAYLGHGRFAELGALVATDDAAQSLIRTWRGHPSHPHGGRTLRITRLDTFFDAFTQEGASILHAPQPPDPGCAWARRRLAPGSFSLTGVTHTLASPRAIELLRGLVDAPFEPYDALICTSQAVVETVRTVTGDYAEFLRERLGGRSRVNTPVRLEVIPLGVDTETFTPSPQPLPSRGPRGQLGVADAEVAILFVGRLSHHAKAHPFPMFRAVSIAAERAVRPVHLMVAGWAANDAVRAAFVDGASAFCRGIRVSFLDGTDPVVRRNVWRAADIFITLAESVQETFGLTVIEAMASGLPVVATDWDGYRGLVEDGSSGHFVPTAMVRGATSESSTRLLCGAIDYDHYLAECSQTTAVDAVPAAAALVARLVSDSDAARVAMGQSARARAVARFAWSKIIRDYERLWMEQDAERRARLSPSPGGPEAYPAPERTFDAYPSRWVDGLRLRRSPRGFDFGSGRAARHAAYKPHRRPAGLRRVGPPRVGSWASCLAPSQRSTRSGRPRESRSASAGRHSRGCSSMTSCASRGRATEIRSAGSLRVSRQASLSRS